MEGRSKIQIIILSAIVFALSACNRYSAEPIEGWIVDAETKPPIEDVIVVANWQLHKSTIAGKVPAAHLHIMETLTDKYGLFYFDTWGPTFAKRGFFIDRDPALFFYKEGYEYHSVQNPLPSEIDNRKVRRSVWNGATIELKRFEGNLNDHASHLSLLHNSMYTILYGKKCEWKKTPILMLAIARKEKIFRKNNIDNILPSLDDIFGYKCGSAEEYLNRCQKIEIGIGDDNHYQTCPSRKLISHTIMPPTVHNGDVDHRLLGIALPFLGLVTVPIASQDYPFPAPGVCASDGNS